MTRVSWKLFENLKNGFKISVGTLWCGSGSWVRAHSKHAKWNIDQHLNHLAYKNAWGLCHFFSVSDILFQGAWIVFILQKMCWWYSCFALNDPEGCSPTARHFQFLERFCRSPPQKKFECLPLIFIYTNAKFVNPAKRHMESYEIFHVYCIFYSGFMCQTTVIFGIMKDGSIVLNTLASWNCFTCRNLPKWG